MTRYAVVDKLGKVVNVIIWEGHEFKIPEGHTLIKSEVCDKNDSYDFTEKTFTKRCNGKKYHESTSFEDYINKL